MNARHRERLALALLVVAATLVFGSSGDADLWVSSQFFDQGRFVGNDWLFSQAVYVLTPWFGMLCLLAAGWRCIRALRKSARTSGLPWRGSAALVLMAFLGVGLVVHTVLKDGWGRARPSEVQPFGGAKAFTPALQPADNCARNCSFVSGHAAGGFALLALGLFGSPRTRRRWLWIAFVAGLTIGLARVSQGRHFASDIVFCLAVLWACGQVFRELWLRQRAWRIASRRRSAPGLARRSSTVEPEES